MKIAIGSDSYGNALKDGLKAKLVARGIEVIDCGEDSVCSVAELVRDKQVDGGILIDESGAFSAIIANKVPGIRAAQVRDVYSARLTKAHNLANILCFGSAVTGIGTAWDCVKVWLDTEFMEGNHTIRLQMIEDLEKKFAK